MQCKWTGCSNPVAGKAQYCSGACRTKASRASVSPFHRASVTDVPVPTVTGDTVDPVDIAPGTVVSYVPGKTVYGRQAVSYPGDTFETRPEPLDDTDTPDPHNRYIYVRRDGSRYILDATGHSHEQGAVA